MKKIIPSLLLAILASSSFLLAQSENRLEATNQVTGCRLELAGTNQTTGCRLQVAEEIKIVPLEDLIGQRVETTTNYNNNQDTGYRLQDTDTNQNTDCRLQQVADKCKIASLLRNDTIPISNLPSSISYLGMTPKLMMNPAMAEEGITNIKRKLECLEGNAPIHNPSASATVDSLTESTAIHVSVGQEILFTRTEEGKNTFEVNEKSQTNGGDALYTNRRTTAGTSTENPKITIPVEQSVDSLDDNSIVQIPATGTMASLAPMGKSLGDRILALPGDLTNYIVEFLRLPEAKQAVYKADHQKAVEELQGKYPELTDKIDGWKRAMEVWNECFVPKEKEARYQDIVPLASNMPLKLYRLVALSQAMKIIEDAIVYQKFLPVAFEKYDKNTETEEAKLAATRAKTYLLTQIGTVNNNIEKLEKAADAVMRLSEQRNRCLVINYRNGIDSDIAINIEKAITSYCQFSQKMKEGEPATAFLLRMEGLYLEGEALFREYKRQRPHVSFTFKQSVLCYLQEIQSFGNWNRSEEHTSEL